MIYGHVPTLKPLGRCQRSNFPISTAPLPAHCSHTCANALVSNSPFGSREASHWMSCIVYKCTRGEMGRCADGDSQTSSALEPVRPTAPISSPSSHFCLVPSLSFSTGIPTQNAPPPSPPFGRITLQDRQAAKPATLATKIGSKTIFLALFLSLNNDLHSYTGILRIIHENT